MEQSSSKLGALWVNKPKSERGPVLTGQINGKRVSVFKNKKWTEAEEKKQPLYHVLLSTTRTKSEQA